MYKNLVFKKILTGIFTIIILAGILVLLIFLNFNTYKQYDEPTLMLVAFLYAGLYLFIFWYVFFVFFTNISIKSDPNVSVKINIDEIINKIKNYFKEATQDGQPVFLIKEINNSNELEISWNRTIDFKQILNYGSSTINYKTTLFFNKNKNICNIHNQIIHISKSIGISGLLYSLDFKGGFVYESGINYIPSFEFKDGKVCMDIKKLSYCNAHIVDPIIEICKSGGWTANFLIFKHKISRVVYSFVGWILFLISICLIIISLLMLN